MKILVTANHTPYIAGGADYHVEGLVQALRQEGHRVELMRLPFHHDEASIERQMTFTEGLEVQAPNGIEVDRVISLQFPAYGVQHPDHVVWLMHQHRVCYELFDPATASEALQRLKPRVEAFDQRHLGNASALFANSPRVAERLESFNGLQAQPLYHPPYRPERLICEDEWGYIFYPSRLEPLKRQSLLVEAAVHLRTPARIVIAGEGSCGIELAQRVEELGVADRVVLMGRISEAEKLTCYAHSLAVFFGPYDEDYGYVTLEAMLAAKPVITCRDSGGPLAFVENGETGWVVEPSPEQVAAVIDQAWRGKACAARMGRAGRQAYAEHDIHWANVVGKLLEG
ncbi:glycosyltransferase family 4 protein [Halomonas sabkhae]|uniref:glycosyltransferase family 4 protein n=1 Tax=Halomonas sabkhae TaxID=626223 RepID=UPI0025B4A9E7|nr:glycosyltransferase family 4 protein [Halomonas sabkhae]MDN3524166.1 glycosyltransferase family 4 protein [Halomonas sabkhae]